VRRSSATAETVEAGEVAEGAFLFDLDFGYVYAEPGRPRNDVDFDNEDYVQIDFHDQAGNECSIIVPRDHPIRVARDGA
jgi:hypothetical protein